MPETTSDTQCSLSTERVELQPGREGSQHPEVGEPERYGRGLCSGSRCTTQPEHGSRQPLVKRCVIILTKEIPLEVRKKIHY